jgi:hypothetical protein
MALRTPPPPPKFAVLDGIGEHRECYLYPSRESMEDCEESLDWPVGWPSRVSHDFLVAHGITVIIA